MPTKRTRKWVKWSVVLVWLLLISASFAWNWNNVDEMGVQLARIHAQSSFQKDITYRSWASKHGGVYVQPTAETPPNPYLKDIPDRDVTTTDGKRLTLINPAYMTRQVHEMETSEVGDFGHITSLKPIRPENAPDSWETKALEAFEAGATDYSSMDTIHGATYLRFMKPLYVEKSCLRCHEQQGYKVGDVRGGISISVPMAYYDKSGRHSKVELAYAHSIIALLGLLGIFGADELLRKSDRNLLKYEANLRLLLDASQTLTSDFDTPTILQSVTEKATQAMNLGSGALYLLNEGKLYLAATTPPLPPDFPDQFRFSDIDDHPHIRKSIEEKAPVVITDTSKEELSAPEQEVIKLRNLMSLLYLPLISEDKVIGILILGSVKEYRTFSGHDIDLYLGFAGQAAKTIENSNLYESLRMSTEELHAKVNELKTTQNALKESEDKYRSLFEQAGDYIFILEPGPDNNLTIVDANESAFRVHGYSRDEMIGMSIAAIDADGISREFFDEIVEKMGSGTTFVFERRHRKRDGSIFWVEVSAKLARYGNNPPVIIAREIDITDRKQAEEERKVLLEQLLQSQKMESIGRLAGGVAHDFNNMLGAILGNVELAKLNLDTEHPLQEELCEIEKAAVRSVELTRHLLGFARKQPASPRVLNINDVVENMFRMLQRLIGENVHLEWLPAEDLWSVRIDPSQIDQIFTNLLVNARDAIDSTGNITIETQNVVIDEDYARTHQDFVPGEYVMFAISDTGCGMDHELKGKIFEPFFTTKPQGQGTGLGLSTVYGIVLQNGGFIHVYSEVDKGTTFKIFIPRCRDMDDVVEAPRDDKIVEKGSETILLVEDEEAVLNLGKKILESLGYRVLTAKNPVSALKKVDAFDQPIDLLITDVMMPEMNGKELSEKLKELYPSIRSLYMSGYTANVIAHNGVIDRETNFIQKPFTRIQLAKSVRTILDMDKA